jgi:phosphoribosyl 1,2-cyclic phosphate phosphodiesterase
VSEHARTVGGRDVRTRAAALIDDGIKIDLPPETVCQLNRDKLRAEDWSAIVFTHSDDDHLSVTQLQYSLYPFTERETPNFTIYGNEAVMARFNARYPDWPFELITTHSFEPFLHAGYTITPIRANHKNDEDSQNLLIESDGKAMIYGTDTGIWPDSTWEFLPGHRLDVLVIECTEGFVPTSYAGHLDIKDCIKVVDRLRGLGVVHAGTKVVTTHHSHQGDATHGELCEALTPHGIVPGHDGMIIEF